MHSMKKQYISPSAIVMDLHLESSVAQTLLVGSREGSTSQTGDEAWTQKKQDNLYCDWMPDGYDSSQGY